ncbi:dipeptidase [Portibacter marinus]|uniref:dipeptidase n=1 Tax=Portibacter marinus TaxID=2898660 RepID=UPI001F1ED3A9|nr:dipeptidase [Portibacter marinus]
MKKLLLAGILATALISCTTKSKVPLNDEAPVMSQSTSTTSTSGQAPSIQEKANQLAQKYIITDGHVDLPYRLKIKNFRLDREYLGIPIETDEGDFDFKRAKEGGLDAPFMSIYIPASYQDGRAKNLADTLIDMVTGIAKELPQNFAIAKSPSDVKKAVKKGLLALPMGMENGAPIEGNLENVGYFKDRGISYITLTHSKDNHICDSSYDTTGTWGGLSPFGYEVVEEMNKKGIMVDISHVSDNTFYQVMKTTKVPAIASHSSCRKFTPGFERNMSDEMIAELGKNGGVIMINFGSTFLDGKVADERNASRERLSALLEEKGLEYGDDEARSVIEAYYKEHPLVFSDVQMVADHIDNVVKIAGVDHVGFGSDYDGVGDSLPTGLKDVSEYPNLIAELLRRGYSEEDIEKMCSGNLFRVWQKVIDYAAMNN